MNDFKPSKNLEDSAKRCNKCYYLFNVNQSDEDPDIILCHKHSDEYIQEVKQWMKQKEVRE